MNNRELVELNLEVSAADATEEEIDRMTRQLLAELKQTNVESVELVKSAFAPEGSKGDPVTIGSLALEVLPVAIPSVIALVQAWVMRGQNRTVKFKGKGIEFEGSPEELKKLLEKLEKGNKKK
jgi:hypothetical protein